jgi:glucose/arabinose dehydrogenase
MRRLLLLPLLALLGACAQGGDQVTVHVQSAAPSSSSSSSASSSSGAAPTVVDTVATGLAVPWGVAFLPSGAAVVTERDSARVLVVNGTDHTVSSVGTIGTAKPQGEGGLLGVAVSPAYAQDHLLYFYVSTADDNRIVSAELRDGALSTPKPVLTGIPLGPIHDGGRLAFGPDGMLYASTGETGDGKLAQDKTSLAGKILRITPSGDPAPGNPFDSPVWSYGHRNVQGLAWVGDQLWASEFGQSSYDELNRIDKGADYGWPEVEGQGGTAQGYVDPQATWSTDVASPSGLAYADGSLWMAALKGERLWQVPVSDDQTAGEPTAWFVGDYGRMRTVVTAPDGSLWVTTSNRDGRGEPKDGDDRIIRVQP